MTDKSSVSTEIVMGNQNQSGQGQPQDPMQQDPKDNGTGTPKSDPQPTPGKNADQQRNGGN
ncbi:hypothetical protein ACQQ2N_04635 [Dokdonella sp. MW10]|uniref:hypothetical protein n=1 Tax=Dokdonella sp. MW10 TaxID=2992926 RepID=UPI003F81F5D1